ncbi:MAG: tRNA (cytidine(34)-2'-O)-methyltransferase [Planctomycetota bacterium]
MSPQSISPQTMSLEDAGFTSPRAHVVLYQPEIPPNTGNIGRTCVAVEAKLWLVQPLGFDLSSAAIRRSGLDYWQHLDVQVVSDWSQLLASLPQTERMFFLSRHAKRPHWEPQFEVGDVFVFGSESSGLPASILDPEDPRSLRLPTNTRVRSLNLATTAGIVMYEHFRQIQVV